MRGTERSELGAAKLGSVRFSGTVLLVGESSVRPVAAALLADGDRAVCWYNRRLVKGGKLGLVEIWARRQMATGWLVATLSESDLGRLV